MWICHTLLGADWLSGLDWNGTSWFPGVDWLWVELQDVQAPLEKEGAGDGGAVSSSSEETSV